MDRAERQETEEKREKEVTLVGIEMRENRSEQTEVRDRPSLDAVLIESRLRPILSC